MRFVAADNGSDGWLALEKQSDNSAEEVVGNVKGKGIVEVAMRGSEKWGGENAMSTSDLFARLATLKFTVHDILRLMSDAKKTMASGSKI